MKTQDKLKKSKARLKEIDTKLEESINHENIRICSLMRFENEKKSRDTS